MNDATVSDEKFDKALDLVTAGYHIRTVVGHNGPDLDCLTGMWMIDRKAVVRKACSISDEWRRIFTPPLDFSKPASLYPWQDEIASGRITMQDVLEWNFMTKGYLGMDNLRFATPFDHHGLKVIRADEAALARFCDYLSTFYGSTYEGMPEELKTRLEILDDEERVELEDFVTSMQAICDVICDNDAYATDTTPGRQRTIVDLGENAETTKNVIRSLRELIVSINRQSENRNPEDVCQLAFIALDGIHHYFSTIAVEDVHRTHRVAREMMMFHVLIKENVEDDDESGRQMGFMPAVEAKYGPDSIESKLLRSRAEAAFLHNQLDWDQGDRDYRDPERTKILNIEKPAVAMGTWKPRVIPDKDVAKVLKGVSSYIEERGGKLPHSPGQFMTDLKRARILPDVLNDEDLEFVLTRIEEEDDPGGDYSQTLIGGLRQVMRRKKTERERRPNNLTLCFVESESDAASKVARFAPDDEGEAIRDQKADFVLHVRDDGLFILSGRKGLMVPVETVYELRKRDLMNRGYGWSLRNATEGQISQLCSTDENYVTLDMPDGTTEDVQIMFWPFWRTAFGTAWLSSRQDEVYTYRANLSKDEIREIVLQTFLSGPSKDSPFTPRQRGREDVHGRQSARAVGTATGRRSDRSKDPDLQEHTLAFYLGENQGGKPEWYAMDRGYRFVWSNRYPDPVRGQPTLVRETKARMRAGVFLVEPVDSNGSSQPRPASKSPRRQEKPRPRPARRVAPVGRKSIADLLSE
ncbi:MAG: hypothetical protein U9Q03_06060 [Patescibacteria group bacterium]|nr:hypothetical protein [Patescibacteria group bacterium]